VKNSVNHFPIDAFVQYFGSAVCENVPYYAECAKKIVAQREDFSDFLRSRGFFVLPSSTNFLFTKKDGRSGKSMYEALKKEGILVRRFDTEGIEEFLRITVGTEGQMSDLKRTMEKLDF
ncbi:MAG: aminotransferase class I/II-fold pyridoxal phosphate-dependent enzyme, partial [Treponemataceae bacterium]|nr:aminotransferase class I/II-fold pyridoxal phosphate-dependent enzyme [Treponemataceae bacterium]